MFSVYLTERDLDTIIAGLREREDRMFRDAQEYKKQDNKPAQFDCIHEMHTAQHLKERLEKLINRNPR